MKKSLTHQRTLLVLFIIGLLVGGCRIKAPEKVISEVFPVEGSETGAYGWVGVTFSQPMDTAAVEEAFSISPAVKGALFWEENTLWFRPLEPYAVGKIYQARLSGTVNTAEEEPIDLDQSWVFSVRAPAILYYDQGEIFRVLQDGSDQLQLSDSNEQVIEFSPERSGEWIAYTAENEMGGQDLWVMDRDGEQERLLVDCFQDLCEEPAWSVDRERIAYTRESYQQDTNGYLPAQIWTVDVASGETSQLYQSDFAFGHSPSFSPDGLKFASYDTTQNGIRILDLQTAQESIVPRILPGVGDWSQDGQQILFTDVLAAENEPYVDVYIVDLVSSDVRPAFGKEVTDTDFSQPRWMPGGEWLAASLRPVNANINKALWVIRLEDAFGIPISEDLSASYSSYQWDPWGNHLVYQRLELSSSDTPTSIWLWDWEARQPRLLVERGARPAWLP